jgi:hypothetical protein
MVEPDMESQQDANSPEGMGANSTPGQDVAGTPTPRRRRPDLATLPDVRREMARVYREMRLQKIPCTDGTRLTYVLLSIGKLIESSDLLARLEALEAAAAARKN